MKKQTQTQEQKEKQKRKQGIVNISDEHQTRKRRRDEAFLSSDMHATKFPVPKKKKKKKERKKKSEQMSKSLRLHSGPESDIPVCTVYVVSRKPLAVYTGLAYKTTACRS